MLLGRIEVAWLFRLQRQCCYAFVPLCLRAKTATAKQVPARFGKLVELRLNIHGGPAVGLYEPEDDNLVTNSSAKHDTAQHGTALHITAHHITACLGHFGPGSARMESQTTAPHSRRCERQRRLHGDISKDWGKLDSGGRRALKALASGTHLEPGCFTNSLCLPKLPLPTPLFWGDSSRAFLKLI